MTNARNIINNTGMGAKIGSMFGPIGTGVGGILGGIGGILGGIGNNKGNDSARALKMQYDYNLALQKQSQQFDEYMYKNRYQMQSEDLENAGINKLYGLSNAPTVTATQGSVGMPDIIGEKNNKIQRTLEMIGLATDWSAKKAQISKTQAETNTENVNTELKKIDKINAMLNAIYKNKEINWYDKRQAHELEKLKAETLNNLSKSEENYAMAGNARALTVKNLKETQIEDENSIINRKINKQAEEFIKKHPKIKGILGGTRAMSEILKGIGTTAGLGIGGAGVAAASKKAKAIKITARKNSARR